MLSIGRNRVITTHEALDNGPYPQLAHLFHALYRIGKVDTGGLSPFAQGFGSRDDVSGLDDAAMNLVREIREKVLGSGDMLNEHNRSPDYDSGREGGEDSSQRLIIYMRTDLSVGNLVVSSKLEV
ncbi:uncharacterized protein L3040_000028 [Drepanopeziza brunnea f. sp. 'multigermtubi']|uniref:uncharacterized protein n=1 Tax=Drepanopeziza brunnea f. sp. 'multigermtubi' TaxID=698441 RepID=UPI00239578D3|nr:hypothetical protein L3040_000028 [Drepanopeziza brunnea f. sp. 'multigermtubi']